MHENYDLVDTMSNFRIYVSAILLGQKQKTRWNSPINEMNVRRNELRSHELFVCLTQG